MGKKKFFPEKENILWILAISQILYLLLFNLFRMESVVNFDSSEYLVQAMQMWTQKKLLISDYYYSTMLAWDMPTLLAALLYGCTGNIFLAYGLSNDIVILLFAFGCVRLMRGMHISSGSQALVLLSVFTVYQYGWFDYVEELFTNGALYSLRLLFLILLMDSVLRSCRGEKTISWLPYYLCSLVGFFVCGLSTGFLTLGCCVLPVWAAVVCRHVLRDKKSVGALLRKTDFWLASMAGVSAATGMLLCRFMNLAGNVSDQKMLLGAESLMSNAFNLVIGLFQLFGWSLAEVPLLSAAGIIQLLGAFVVVCYVFSFVCCVRRRRRSLDNGSTQAMYVEMLLWIALVNVTLFLTVKLTYALSTFEYRYWLLVLIPVMPALPIAFDAIRNHHGARIEKMIKTIFVLSLVVISLYKDVNYAFYENGASEHGPMMHVVAGEDPDVLFIYDDFFTGRQLTTYAPMGKEYFAVCNEGTADNGIDWISSRLRMPKWGTFVKYDGDCLASGLETCAVLVSDSVGADAGWLHAQAVRTVDLGNGYHLCLFEENVMDFSFGIPAEGAERSRDYLAWGYETNGFEMSAEGLTADSGDEHLLSGSFEADHAGVFDLYLQYEISSNENAEGLLSVTVYRENGTEYRHAVTFGAEDGSCCLPGVTLGSGDRYLVTIRLTGGASAVLKYLDYCEIR